MSKTITAIYDNHAMAHHAINLLEKNGVDETKISILASDGSIDKTIEIEENTKAPEGASIGAGLGAVAGAVLGGLTAVGTVTITGGAGLLAAGPIVSAFAGAGAGAGTGGVIGGLVGLGVPETEAKVIDGKLGDGHIMLGVTVQDDKEQIVKELLSEARPDSMHTVN